MNLREGERLLQTYHHHPTPFVINILKVLTGAFPFFFLLYLFHTVMSQKAYIIANAIIFAIFAFVLVYASLIYWLDKVIITNYRIIHIDWRTLSSRNESEALLNDIQDIATEEKGILSALKIFDYGKFSLDTASSHVTIEFFDAPDPEGMRKFIYHVKSQ